MLYAAMLLPMPPRRRKRDRRNPSFVLLCNLQLTSHFATSPATLPAPRAQDRQQTEGSTTAIHLLLVANATHLSSYFPGFLGFLVLPKATSRKRRPLISESSESEMAVDWFTPSAFDWGDAPPLSSFEAVATASVLYVVGVMLTTAVSLALIPANPAAKNSQGSSGTTDLQWQPWFNSDLKQVQFIHNVNLVGSSAIMLGGVILESIRRIQAEGGVSWPPFLLCEVADGVSASGSLYYWSYIYYLSKYYELLDTILQLARGKPPPHFVLHVYHHAAVLFMAWAWVEYKQSLHFIGLAWNTAVHVVMYTYFLQRTITRKVPRWKSFVTLFQIIQFAFSMVATVVTLYIVFVQKYECSGMNALFGNVLFNITLLYSFIQVFLQGKRTKAGAKKKN